MTISPEFAEDLYRFIWRIVEDSKCKLIRIGGIQNHIHMLIDLHPSVALSVLMRDVKASSSGWMKGKSKCPFYNGWAKEFYACTLSPEHKHAVIEYIKGQKVHHQCVSFDSEIVDMCRYIDKDCTDADFQ